MTSKIDQFGLLNGLIYIYIYIYIYRDSVHHLVYHLHTLRGNDFHKQGKGLSLARKGIPNVHTYLGETYIPIEQIK